MANVEPRNAALVEAMRRAEAPFAITVLPQGRVFTLMLVKKVEPRPNVSDVEVIDVRESVRHASITMAGVSMAEKVGIARPHFFAETESQPGEMLRRAWLNITPWSNPKHIRIGFNPT